MGAKGSLETLMTIYKSALLRDSEHQNAVMHVHYKPFSRQFYIDMNEIHL